MGDGDETVLQAVAALRVGMLKGLGDLGAELFHIAERLDRLDTGQAELRVDLAMEAVRKRMASEGGLYGSPAAPAATQVAEQADGGQAEDLRSMMRDLQRSHEMLLEQFTVLARRAKNTEMRLVLLEAKPR